MTHAPVPTTATNITNQYDDHRLETADDSRTIGWHELLAALAEGGTFWLTTIAPVGQPHTRPVFAVQLDGGVYTASSRGAAKVRALHAGGLVSLAASRPGIDIVWSGTSRSIDDPDELAGVADAYVSTYGWEVAVDGDALTAPYGAPRAGPPPYDVFGITPRVVHAFATDAPFTGRSTRWDVATDVPVSLPGSIVVAGHLRVAADQRDSYLESCRTIVTAARTAEGCLDFAISADVADPERINVYERWTGADTLHQFRDDGPTDDQAAALIDARVEEFHTPAASHDQLPGSRTRVGRD